MLHALTKCDAWSWCAEIKTLNATMTRESLNGAGHNGQTMSHPWGTGALSGIVHGIVGVKQTGVAWSTFTVKPLLASKLTFVNATVPTIRGPIVVAATPGAVAVTVPCNTQARLCVQSGAAAEATALLLDGVEVAAMNTEQHLCTAAPVGCAASARVLSAVAR